MRVTNGDLPILAVKPLQNTALMHGLDLSGLEKLRFSRILPSTALEAVKPDTDSG